MHRYGEVDINTPGLYAGLSHGASTIWIVNLEFYESKNTLKVTEVTFLYIERNLRLKE